MGSPPGGRSKGVSRGQEGVGRGSSWGNPQSHPGGGSRTSSVVVLAPQPTQIQGDNDRYFTLTLGLSSGPLHLTLTSEVGEVSESPSQLTKESLTGVLQGSCPQRLVGPRAPASCQTGFRVQNPHKMTSRKGADSGVAYAQPPGEELAARNQGLWLHRDGSAGGLVSGWRPCLAATSLTYIMTRGQGSAHCDPQAKSHLPLLLTQSVS